MRSLIAAAVGVVSVVLLALMVHAATFTAPLTGTATGGSGGMFLIGDWGGSCCGQPWHTQFSRYPDFSGNFTTLYPDGNSSNPCAAIPNGNGDYPTFATAEPLGANSFLDPNAAAAGSYNSAYDSMASQIAACASTVYYIRVASEWSQPFCAVYNPWCGPGGGGTVNWPGGSPCGTPSIPAATFVSMMQNLITRLRANSSLTHVPIYFDYPFTTNSGCDESAFYPGDSFVDLVGSDFYYFPVSFPGSSSAQVFNIALGGTNTLPSIQDMEAFAANHGKKVNIVEICDAFTDGGFLLPFYQRALANGYVGVDYWDNDQAIPGGETCMLQEVAGRANAFNSVVGGTSYGQTFFAHKPIDTVNNYWN